jgi:hypothetical protein
MALEVNGRRWKLLLAAGLALASGLLYAAFFAIHPDRGLVADWFLGSLAFVPFQVLIVTLIVDGLLGRREQQARLKKLNIVIGVFFSEVGMELLGACLSLERRAAELSVELAHASSWSPDRLGAEAARYRSWETSAEPRVEPLERLRELLLARRGVLTSLMTNPSVLEHEHFTDLLWAVFHLAEELGERGEIRSLPATDLNHLAGDVQRVFPILIGEWLSYLRHLQEDYPYLYSLAGRTNPFDPHARVEVRPLQ